MCIWTECWGMHFVLATTTKPIRIDLESIQNIILKYSETLSPICLVKFFDFKDEYTRRLILKCIYDWGWLLETWIWALTLIAMSLYQHRRRRLACFCKSRVVHSWRCLAVVGMWQEKLLTNKMFIFLYKEFFV